MPCFTFYLGKQKKSDKLTHFTFNVILINKVMKKVWERGNRGNIWIIQLLYVLPVLWSWYSISSYFIVSPYPQNECNNIFLPFGKLLQQPHFID